MLFLKYKNTKYLYILDNKQWNCDNKFKYGFTENNYCSIRENGEWKFKDLNNLIHKNKSIVIYNNFIELID